MFWNRPLLKTNAKKVLATSYWRVFVVCLIGGLLTGGGSGNGFSLGANLASGNASYLSYDYGAVATTIAGASLLAILFTVFIGNPILVGMCRYMMENRVGFPPIGSLFSVFRDSKQYWNVVKVMFFMDLEIFLWSLLCVIPGIYKSYQYFYVSYLLAENPYLDYTRAKQLSTAMTNNEKMEIFILGISFIGWQLLGAMLCGVGILFVQPYVQATFAELYAAARAKAFSLGVTGENELADFTRYNSPNQGF